jgi:hypothetical protein
MEILSIRNRKIIKEKEIEKAIEKVFLDVKPLLIFMSIIFLFYILKAYFFIL